ncbi:P-loop containing nucleoside triphosphate hydrolase protein [Macrolepiota fuliginosa MF-IS2]|uniref:P-loop containing nucleoside triphosphate hydrolase protein n=1 Tax=Macrolepiota fuliginosa MF-IS2 TaxID=1400762 RepID=A0A9P5XDK1_9AGAR|nr:P-loop containing nucleoside triphosphate hydrolase protein [Macrolepiota fuliginosa MF-IS2]
MTLFAPNGLLGSTSALEANSEPASAGEFSLKPNGLLGDVQEGTGSLEESEGLSKRVQDVPSFTLTRLLSKAKTTQTHAEAPGSTVSSSEATPMTFTRTSLLSGVETFVEQGDIAEAFYDAGVLIPESDLSFSSNTGFGHPSTLLDQGSVFEPPPPGSIRAMSFSGKTIFLKKRKRKQSPTTSTSTTSPFSNLLDTPIHRLLDDLSATVARKLQISAAESSRTTALNTRMEDTLWVDRYRPACFTDLIGNDRVARETMAWVKQWDYCVFGKKKGKKRQRDGDENFNTDDEYHRPGEKILLLSGPPGLGKTTLAHVVAHHAGYDVMEVNASDTRAGNVVDERIRPALESGASVNGTRPVLVVIDEIDGATGAGENTNSFIHNLVQLTQNKWKKKKRSGQKQQPSAQRPLLRPIICICNDINASSLVKLKPHAYQVRFTRPADFHTVRRLQEICDNEGLKADTRALNTLVAMAKGDLRGCINTLQFIKSRKEEVTETVIRTATTGMKEGDTSILSVLNSIFSPLTKKRTRELAMTEEQESRYVSRLNHEIESSGKDAAVANGCFEHYATVRHHDANFSRYERANEWLITYDVLSSSMYVDGEFALLPYLSHTLVPFYPLFQTRGSQRIERNYSDWEHHQLTKSNEGIYESFARCLRSATLRQEGGAYRHLVSTPILQLEFTPFINRIISPPLRPVNSQVIRAEERLLLARLVEIMSALELRFVQDRGEEGQLSYRLEPPIDVFITYDGKRANDIAASRYAVRHLVATEVGATLAARDFDVVEKGKGGKRHTDVRLSSNETNSHADVKSSGPAPKRLKTSPPDIADKTPTDFFGRAITVKSTTNSKSAVQKQKVEPYRVSYKFNEGNSAAVRKPVKLNTFL